MYAPYKEKVMFVRMSVITLIASMGALEAARQSGKKVQPAAQKESAKKETSEFRTISSEAQFTSLTKEQTPKVVVFIADWCTARDSHLEALERTAKNYPAAQIYTFDVGNDSYKEFRSKWEIRSFPTTLFLVKGTKQLERGSMSEAELKTQLDGLVNAKKK